MTRLGAHGRIVQSMPRDPWRRRWVAEVVLIAALVAVGAALAWRW